MREFLAAVFIILAAGFLFGFAKISSSQSQPPNCKWINDALVNTEKIKVGVKRRDLNEMFSVDGGISSTTERFVYKKCNFIKVEVKFKFVDENSKFSKRNPEDEIIEISKPYLEHPFSD